MATKRKDKNAFIEYKVTKEIIRFAEELGIKGKDESRGYQPLDDNLEKYISIVKAPCGDDYGNN